MNFSASKAKALFGRAEATPQPSSRLSSGLDQFCAFLQSREGMAVLDMSGASQANISFVTELGHRISSDDIIGTMMEHFGSDFLESQQAASNAQRFVDSSLTFPDGSFDAILVWDALQFLTPPLLNQTVAQLLRILRPGGAMLVFFSSDEKARSVSINHYRVQDRKHLLQTPRHGTKPQKAQYFNNRALEKLFVDAASVKFFLTRDHLRELIVRK